MREPGADRRLLTGWGRTAPSAAVVAEPADDGAVEALLAASAPSGLIVTNGSGPSNGGNRMIPCATGSATTSKARPSRPSTSISKRSPAKICSSLSSTGLASKPPSDAIT